MIYKNDYDNKTIILINLILFEVFITILSSTYVSLEVDQLLGVPKVIISKLTVIVSTVVGVISMFLLREITRLAEKEQEAKISEILLAERKETIELLRTHRHDFLNHLQVISGMLQLNKVDNSLEYVKQIVGEIKTVSIDNNIENPVLAALFLKKRSLAEQNEVIYTINIKSQLKGISVSYSDLSRIVGNLIDNAIYAAANGNDQNQKKLVEINVCEDEKTFEISVQNTGNPIAEEFREKIFERGFTTKGKDGNGLGLYIVKNLVSKNKGQIALTCGEAGKTIFTVSFPKVN